MHSSWICMSSEKKRDHITFSGLILIRTLDFHIIKWKKKEKNHQLMTNEIKKIMVWFRTHPSSDRSCHQPRFVCLAHRTLPVKVGGALKSKLHPRQTLAHPNRCHCSSPENRQEGERSHAAETARVKRRVSPALGQFIKYFQYGSAFTLTQRQGEFSLSGNLGMIEWRLWMGWGVAQKRVMSVCETIIYSLCVFWMPESELVPVRSWQHLT